MPFTVNTELSVPSKTFLLGEYLVLTGGPALLVATGPRFSMRVRESKEAIQNFHPDSPAGRLLKSHKKYFFEFKDPYSSSGGLGASSAQFILAQAFLESGRDWLSFYQKFRDLHALDKTPPSGGDVVAQVNGGLTYFHPSRLVVKKAEWQFSDLDFSLFKTTQKLATHHHLKETSQALENFSNAQNEIVEQAYSAIESARSAEFIDAFRAFGDCLAKFQLVSEKTRKLLNELHGLDPVLAAKGCGAMGADVVCILHRPKIRLDLSKYGLKYLASSAQIENDGLRFDSEPARKVYE